MRRAALIIFFALLLALSAKAAAEPSIIDIIVIDTDEKLRVFCTLESAFSEDVMEAIRGGVTTSFSYYIELMRKRSLWYDENVARKVLKHTVKFDSLKKEFTLRRESSTGEKEVRHTRDEEEAKDWLTEINGEPLRMRDLLKPGERYYVRVKADLNTVDFSFPLKWILFFLGDETDWSRSAYFKVKGP